MTAVSTDRNKKGAILRIKDCLIPIPSGRIYHYRHVFQFNDTSYDHGV